MRLSSLLSLCAAAVVKAGWWLEDIDHQGISPFNPDSSYQVWRNVKDFGAAGDGVTDDTAAINQAISSGNRCGPGTCAGNTITPAVVYFPAGIYIINSSIIDYFYTQLIGDATNPPTIKATADFPTATTFGLIDGDQYGANGLGWPSTNVFYRQIRNFIIDTTAIPADSKATGIHWPSSQATSITNVVFQLSQAPGNNHTGLFIEEGSGGLLNDLVFYGGQYGAQLGNQQYTARNLSFYNADIAAISQLWSWSWTYKSLHVENCPAGVAMVDNQTASVSIVDSTFTNVDTAVFTTRNPPTSSPPAAGSLVLENVQFTNVNKILSGSQGTIIAGNPSGTIVQQGYAMGDTYTPNGPNVYQGDDASLFPDHSALKVNGAYYERSKPQYEDEPVSSFVSARTYGAKGDGSTDDTDALNGLFSHCAANNLIAYVDAGTYIVTNTIKVPAGSRIVGEPLSAVIMATGATFGNITSPKAVLKIGSRCQSGYVELSDLIISVRGPNPGAKLIEYNLASPGTPSGLWDVHARVGGAAGSDLQLAQCPTYQTGTNVINDQCIAAWGTLHITKSASNLLVENSWLWVADHDLEDPNYTQITVFAGRGLLAEATAGKIWLSATGVEHHTLYQYQFLNTQSIYLAMPQTETPYYQPNPPANLPFPVDATHADPDFVADCAGVNLPGYCAMAWGLRVLSSSDIVAFGVGLYSFFNNYSTNCSQITTPTKCQARIFDIVNLSGQQNVSNLETYNFNTIGSTSMITRLGQDVAIWSDNEAAFSDVIAVYQND